MSRDMFKWLVGCVESAPDNKCLEGIRITIEWVYSIDKDWEAFCELINLINKKMKHD